MNGFFSKFAFTSMTQAELGRIFRSGLFARAEMLAIWFVKHSQIQPETPYPGCVLPSSASYYDVEIDEKASETQPFELERQEPKETKETKQVMQKKVESLNHRLQRERFEYLRSSQEAMDANICSHTQGVTNIVTDRVVDDVEEKKVTDRDIDDDEDDDEESKSGDVVDVLDEDKSPPPLDHRRVRFNDDDYDDDDDYNDDTTSFPRHHDDDNRHTNEEKRSHVAAKDWKRKMYTADTLPKHALAGFFHGYMTPVGPSEEDWYRRRLFQVLEKHVDGVYYTQPRGYEPGLSHARAQEHTTRHLIDTNRLPNYLSIPGSACSSSTAAPSTSTNIAIANDNVTATASVYTGGGDEKTCAPASSCNPSSSSAGWVAPEIDWYSQDVTEGDSTDNGIALLPSSSSSSAEPAPPPPPARRAPSSAPSLAELEIEAAYTNGDISPAIPASHKDSKLPKLRHMSARKPRRLFAWSALRSYMMKRHLSDTVVGDSIESALLFMTYAASGGALIISSFIPYILIAYTEHGKSWFHPAVYVPFAVIAALMYIYVALSACIGVYEG